MLHVPKQVVVTPALVDVLTARATASRLHILDMLTRAKASHIGSAFSVIDILTVLYACFVDTQAIRQQRADRDYVILSKGHSASALYAALAGAGIISTGELATFYKDGSVLGGHPIRQAVPGIEASTGSLGHGLSIAVGLALAAKHSNSAQRAYVVIGDGECQEGSVWEAVAMAARFKLSNLTAIVDANNLQGLSATQDVMSDLDKKFQAFGCAVRHVDGHSYEQLIATLNEAGSSTRPEVIIAKTIKGKGVELFEHKLEWHYKSCNKEQYICARKQLEGV